jgi:hypothetical protein
MVVVAVVVDIVADNTSAQTRPIVVQAIVEMHESM